MFSPMFRMLKVQVAALSKPSQHSRQILSISSLCSASENDLLTHISFLFHVNRRRPLKQTIFRSAKAIFIIHYVARSGRRLRCEPGAPALAQHEDAVARVQGFCEGRIRDDVVQPPGGVLALPPAWDFPSLQKLFCCKDTIFVMSACREECPLAPEKICSGTALPRQQLAGGEIKIDQHWKYHMFGQVFQFPGHVLLI